MKKTKPWNQAKIRSFIISALRKAHWPVKYEAIRKAYVRDGINPATGRKCKLHRCQECGELFPAKDMQADHIEPVIPLDCSWSQGENFLGYDWNQVVARLFCKLENYQALCKDCHKIKTSEERKLRNQYKKEFKSDELLK